MKSLYLNGEDKTDSDKKPELITHECPDSIKIVIVEDKNNFLSTVERLWISKEQALELGLFLIRVSQ